MQNPFLEKKSSRSTETGRWEWAGLFLLSLLILSGVAYSAIVPSVARFTDEDEYLKLSSNLVHGPGFSLDGVHLTASRPPGYPFFLAAIRALGGGFISFRVVQFFLLGATLVLVSRLCSEKKPLGGVLIVTVLAICYPVLFYTGATLYPQTLAGFLLVLALSLLVRAPKTVMDGALTGLAFGALILTVPTFLFTTAIALAAAWGFRMIRARDLAVTAVAAGLVVGSWTVRNAVCFDHFVPIATNSGLNLLEGNNEHATALAAANVGMQPYYDEADRRGLDEFQRDDFYRESALHWMEANPGDAIVLYFEKAANFFNIVNVYSPEIQTQVAPWKQAVLAAGYLLLLGLLAWRLAEIKQVPLLPREKLFLVVYLLSAFATALFFTRIRHRLPYDYLIIAIVAHDLSRRLESYYGTRRSAIDSTRS